MKKILFFLFTFASLSSIACHNSLINSVSSVNNGNNTTTYTIDFTVDVGSNDGYSYGFALVFSNTTATAPIVLSNPAFTPILSRPNFNDLTAYTGINIGSGLGAANSSNYFDDRYGNRSDVLTYETDDDWFGFGSTDYTKTVVVTIQGCVETIMLDADFRSTGSATIAGLATCTDSYQTGVSCLVSCGTCTTPNCLIAGPYSSYNDAFLFSNHCSQMNDLSTNPVTASTYVTYHTLTTSATGTVGMVISLQEGGPTTPCGITKVANLYASNTNCATPIGPSTTTANASTFYNPEWTGLTPNATYIVEITFTIPSGCSLIDHCESFYFPTSCNASTGTVSISGGTLVGNNVYDLTNCNTINFNAANENLNGGVLTYGYALFSCDPGLPLSAAQLADLTNHPCYLGSDYGLTTSDVDAGGVSGTVSGGYDTLWIMPYTSDAANSPDSDGDGCYDIGDVVQVNYLAPTCGDCATPNCSAGSVPEFVDRTYLQCDDPCADLNNITHTTYHTVSTDNFGNVGAVQTVNFSQFSCSGLSRTAVLRSTINSCSGPDIQPSVNNANGVGSGFNPEWYGLSANTNYTLIVTTTIGSNCNYDYACLDFYGIPTCNTINTNLDTTLCNGESIVVNGTTYNGANPTGQETFVLANGCDSIVSVTVTELPPITNSINPTICSNGNYVYDGVTYDANNTSGTHIFTSALGCDSTVTVTLTIQNVINSNIDTTLCNGGSIVVNGTTYNGSNPTGQETFTLPGGCDSVVSITVTELGPITNSINPTICSNSSYVYDGVTYDSSNTTGTHVFTSALGCDSTVTITLTLQNVIYSTVDTTLCNGGSIVVNGTTYNGANPTGQETFILPGGCDSIVNITVTELALITNIINPIICSNGSFTYDGITYDSSNTSGTHIFTSAFGCDSTVTVAVIVQNQITNNIEQTICFGDSIIVNGTTYNASNPIGQEIITLPSGCDSVINISITELNQDTTFLDTIIYVGQSIDISGVVLIESDFEGLVYLQAANGCDSVLSIRVQMLYESTHFVPSGFSPNGDGVNDFIGVMGGGIQEMEFSIFNRWGEVVFNSDCCCSTICSWDGKHRNKVLNVGTYVYYLKGTYNNGMPFTEKGTISLVK